MFSVLKTAWDDLLNLFHFYSQKGCYYCLQQLFSKRVIFSFSTASVTDWSSCDEASIMQQPLCWFIFLLLMSWRLIIA